MTAQAAQKTKPKPQPPFTLPDEPIDRHRVEYYRISGYHDDPRIVRICLVYHVNSAWLEVCPDRNDRDGANFVNHWQVFSDGDFTGRTRDGWDVVLAGPWDETFKTYEEARAFLLGCLTRSLEDAREKVREIEERIRAARGAPEKTIACPTCKRLEHETNHPLGMMFVGMGRGWQVCSQCGGSTRIRAEDAHV